MQTEDTLFENIRELSDTAESMGLEDVALVLEFALDVYLSTATPTPDADPLVLTQPAPRKMADLLRVSDQSWSMSSFPMTQLDRKAS